MGARRYQEDACAFATIGPRERTRPGTMPVPVMAGGLPGLPERESALATGSGVVAVLADGMGGHVGGARASRTACQAFIATYAGSGAPIAARMESALLAANSALADVVEAEPKLRGMGCTLVAAIIEADKVRWISVGDSHLFLFRRGELFLLNEDHSMGPVFDELAARGEMSREDAANHPRRHYLRSALTGEEIELTDFAADGLALEAGDCVVLTSDGIDTLGPDAIRDLIEHNFSHSADAIAQALIEAIDNRHAPFQDNTTVMAIAVRSA